MKTGNLPEINYLSPIEFIETYFHILQGLNSRKNLEDDYMGLSSCKVS